MSAFQLLTTLLLKTFPDIQSKPSLIQFFKTKCMIDRHSSKESLDALVAKYMRFQRLSEGVKKS